MPDLIGGEECGPVALGHEPLDAVPAHVDAVVEVAAPDDHTIIIDLHSNIIRLESTTRHETP